MADAAEKVVRPHCGSCSCAACVEWDLREGITAKDRARINEERTDQLVGG